jgi:hypothetical protein
MSKDNQQMNATSLSKIHHPLPIQVTKGNGVSHKDGRQKIITKSKPDCGFPELFYKWGQNCPIILVGDHFPFARSWHSFLSS